MKKLHPYMAGLGLLLSAGSFAQQTNPDQNPNYKVSMDYYMENRQELTANQGQTSQQTYKAYDWTTHKAEVKQQKQDRKDELQKMRYQSRYRCSYGTNPYYPKSVYNTPYYSPYYAPLWYGAGIYSFIF
ncbi:MAG: hypothetical protein HYZ14_05665 [Bacteroidetes bacterium]|nr:hypothetical protein [Bacteroidota bacterium]